VILRRLAVFAGVFSPEAASAVVASAEVTPSQVVDGLANLVTKSLSLSDDIADAGRGVRTASDRGRRQVGIA
jgi:predicted ATPase